MTVDAVLFDVAGTLAIPEGRDAWLTAAAATAQVDLTDHDPAALAAELERVGRPGGPYPATVPDAIRDTYNNRDAGPDVHRQAYVALLQTAAPYAALATALYERVLRPEGWIAYPDAAPTLQHLQQRGIRTAAVSNVGFDLRPVLDGLGLLRHLDAVVLSYEVGAVKPQPEIFRAALAAVGVADPATALMVGDHAAADGGAADAGIRTLLIPMSPPGAPHGLGAVLRLV